MAATVEETNFARTSRIIIDLCSNVLRDTLSRIIQPSQFSTNNFLQSLPRRTKRPDQSQQNVLQQVEVTKSYNICDITLLYYLIRNICCSNPNSDPKYTPSQGWGNVPLNQMEVKVGDDLERIRNIRNHYLGHTVNAWITTNDFQQFIATVEPIFQRFDAL